MCWSGSIHSFVHLQSTGAGWLFTGNLSSQAELAELVNFLGVVFVVLYGCFLELGHPYDGWFHFIFLLQFLRVSCQNKFHERTRLYTYILCMTITFDLYY